MKEEKRTDLVGLKEGLNIRRRFECLLHHLVAHAVKSGRPVGHHPQHGQVVAGLVTFAASLVLVVDDVLADVAVNVLLAVEELNLTFKYFVDFSMTRNGFLCYEPIRAHFE